MSVAATTENKTLYTPEDLLAMPDGKNYELIDGRLVERNMGSESSWVGGRIYLRLSLFCDEHQSGYVWPADNGYQCFGHVPNWSEGPTFRSSAKVDCLAVSCPRATSEFPPTWPSKSFLPTTWRPISTRSSKTTRERGWAWSG